MDIVTFALAKKYVNTRIADMGTLQRLQGRVDTYDDLLKISNPQPGDTYVVGTPSEENSEYMFIGDEWEKLGPMLDLSNLYTKPEVDAMFTNITNYAPIASHEEIIDILNGNIVEGIEEGVDISE